ncbi:unnamed protein product [Heligmosomoides polygyrus]|uniref:Uncharacterized protein n=1 Tax=Heligmosomoides polygyrus TaxID=6339 RepID=A0A183G6Y5_HELPZ|nr:unnamed protein product [Heligmosomoides polygyrus]
MAFKWENIFVMSGNCRRTKVINGCMSGGVEVINRRRSFMSTAATAQACRQRQQLLLMLASTRSETDVWKNAARNSSKTT